MATTVCATGCVHTHTLLSHAHFLCVTYRHRVRAWLKVFAVCMSHISISLSLFSCFIRHPCCSRTVTSTPRSRPHRLRRALPDPKARVKRTSARAPGSLATWPIPRTPQVMSQGKHQNQKGNRTNNTSNTSNTDINTCKSCGRTGHWAKDY